MHSLWQGILNQERGFLVFVHKCIQIQVKLQMLLQQLIHLTISAMNDELEKHKEFLGHLPIYN